MGFLPKKVSAAACFCLHKLDATNKSARRGRQEFSREHGCTLSVTQKMASDLPREKFVPLIRLGGMMNTVSQGKTRLFLLDEGSTGCVVGSWPVAGSRVPSTGGACPALPAYC